MSPGKLAAQVAHASVGAILVTSREHLVNEWRKQGMPKIVLKCANEEELNQLEDAAAITHITFRVCDAGHTELPPGTVTALAIGPANAEEIDKITGKLSLY